MVKMAPDESKCMWTHGKSFPFTFPYLVLFVLQYFPFHVDSTLKSSIKIFLSGPRLELWISCFLCKVCLWLLCPQSCTTTEWSLPPLPKLAVHLLMCIMFSCCRYLCLHNKTSAKDVFDYYTTQHPNIKKTGPPYILPLLNFIWFLLKVIERCSLVYYYSYINMKGKPGKVKW